nr:D-alanyl-D-alanine carboxypeptidase family protein [uncultured Blautia sp.]
MKKKKKNLWKTLLLCTALTVSSCVTPVMAAQADDTENSTPEEPAKPESYDWEIQSNKIPGWPQGPKVVAETAILMDIDSGSILYAKGIDKKRAPASTTKIMTAMLALEQVPFDTQITFTDEVNNIEADSTHIGIKPGETLTMKDCAYAILLASANEVSSGVAEYIGGDVQTFVDSMNQRAKDLGCQNTHFVNANGLYSEDHYTTARDLAIISCAAFQNETFREIIKTPYYIVPETNITNETRWLNNHHKMVLPDSSEYYEGCLGGKTGYTVKAGNTLVTYAERNGMRLVCVVLADINEHYNDTKALFDYGFQNFQKTAPQAETFSATKDDTLGVKLLEQGILTPVFQNSSLIVPKEQKGTLSFQTALEEDNTLLVTYRYGETVLGSSSLPATDEILAAAKELGIRKEAAKQGNMTFQKESEEKETDITPDSSKETGSSSPKGLVHDMTETFRELPNWKYPALLFIATAMIFYIVTLSVRIRRSHKRRKKNKKRKKGEF